jgi:hypothetical protein
MTRVDGNTDATPPCGSCGATIAALDACFWASRAKPDGSGGRGRCVEMNKLRARAHGRGDASDQTRSLRTDGDETGHQDSGGANRVPAAARWLILATVLRGGRIDLENRPVHRKVC